MNVGLTASLPAHIASDNSPPRALSMRDRMRASKPPPSSAPRAPSVPTSRFLIPACLFPTLPSYACKVKENQFQAATRAPRPPVQWQKASTMRPSDHHGRLYYCQRAPLRSLVSPPLSSDLPYITLLLLPPHPPPPPPTLPPPPLIIGQARRARREAEATASARARCMFAPQPRGHLGPPRGPIHPLAATPDAVGLLVRKARKGV